MHLSADLLKLDNVATAEHIWAEKERGKIQF